MVLSEEFTKTAPRAAKERCLTSRQSEKMVLQYSQGFLAHWDVASRVKKEQVVKMYNLGATNYSILRRTWY